MCSTDYVQIWTPAFPPHLHDDTLTILALSAMCGANNLTILIGPLRFVFLILLYTVSLHSYSKMPALFTKHSIFPLYLSAICCEKAFMDAGSLTSSCSATISADVGTCFFKVSAHSWPAWVIHSLWFIGKLVYYTTLSTLVELTFICYKTQEN